jgi:uncharacterized membrane protein HdeD (DUF308 family)
MDWVREAMQRRGAVLLTTGALSIALGELFLIWTPAITSIVGGVFLVVGGVLLIVGTVRLYSQCRHEVEGGV